jgi:hypothetical protein
MTNSRRALTIAACTVAACGTGVATASAAKPKPKTRSCDAVVQRVIPFGQQAPVMQAATRIWVRGATCGRIRDRIGTSILQVGAASPTPPPGCCESAWYSDDADWWRKAGWKVERGIGANSEAPNGARFIVSKGNIRLRFTRWT